MRTGPDDPVSHWRPVVLHELPQHRDRPAHVHPCQPPREAPTMSSRVTIQYDDDTKIDFEDLVDAVAHAHVQGVAGVTAVVDEDSGDRVMTRKQLQDVVDKVREQAPTDAGEAVKVARKTLRSED